MILGVGTDLVEIYRIEKACERSGFLRRVYTEKERRQAQGSASKLAGSFAVKEAVAKALGTGFRGFLPADVEVVRNELGKPEVFLYRGALARFRQMGGERMEVSISNTDTLVMAFAVAEGRSGNENPCNGEADEGD